MSTFIEDDSGNETVLPTEYEVHIDKFGVEPNVIGMFWSEPKLVLKNILESIKDSTPYDEYNMLSKSDQEAYDNGELLF